MFNKLFATRKRLHRILFKYVHFIGPVGQTVTSNKSMSSLSLTGMVLSQDLNSDIEQYSEPTSPTQPMEEDCEESGWEATKAQRDLYQEVSEEQIIMRRSEELDLSWGGNMCLSLSPRPPHLMTTPFYVS